MTHKPGIRTAIPKARYSYGEFTAILLGDVESSDGMDYRFIMAFIRGQDPEPGLYITAERQPGSRGRVWSMRVIMRDGAGQTGESEQWHEQDAFASEALRVASRILSLSDETPWRLS